MTKEPRPRIAITMGDPAGIGPEVTAKALRNRQVQDSCLPCVVMVSIRDTSCGGM